MESGEFVTRLMSQKDKLYRLAKSMLCDASEAEDAVQDVVERLWVRREDLTAHANLNAFMITSVRNACLDRLRKRKIRQGTNIDEYHGVLPDAGDGTSHEKRDMRAIAEALINRLPDTQRMIIHFRDVEGYPMEEIAGLTGIDEASVRVYLSRARKKVREDLIKIFEYGT